jgi:glutathione S-transferase
MRLWQNPGSPFARKVRIAARESGLESRIEELPVMVSPVNPNTELARRNPLVKIPALEIDDGSVLYDSTVICEYLDTLNAGAKLIPMGAARWPALRLQALCNGIMEAAVLCRYENAMRAETQRSQGWVDGQFVKIRNALDALEREVPAWGQAFGIGQIAAACVTGYLDFRFPQEAWRASRPRLAAWHQAIAVRPSVAATVPSG